MSYLDSNILLEGTLILFAKDIRQIVFITKSPLFDKIIFIISLKIILQELRKKYVNYSEAGWFGLMEFISLEVLFC